ncbi:hypothetical protein WG66_014799 [Moniliophthora roreri]|nr:hypothetical protein WG66_014799 [Moniliophthora roreri]
MTVRNHLKRPYDQTPPVHRHLYTLLAVVSITSIQLLTGRAKDPKTLATDGNCWMYNMDPPPVVIVFLSTWMRVSLDIKIKQWKWHWQNTILCFPDKVKQFKKDVKRERKITPDDYECSTFNCAPQVKILVFNPGVVPACFFHFHSLIRDLMVC